jgi:hypothetical protein
MAKVTIWGMINPFDQAQTVFDLLELPTSVDRESCINNIMMRCGDFEMTYPNFGFMREAVGVWSKKYQSTFEKWASVLATEYNPLENYNRVENGTRHGVGEETQRNELNVNSYSNTEYDETTGSSQNEHSVVPFNKTVNADNDYINVDKDVASMQSKTGMARGSYTYDNRSLEKEDGEQYASTVSGNIGVTTSQQMLESELKIREWNLYDHIADLFVTEFCIAIY